MEGWRGDWSIGDWWIVETSQRAGGGEGMVEVEKQISPLRSSQGTRAASVEMTILFEGERERRTTLAGPVIGVQLDIEKKKRAEIGSLSPLSLKVNR
jgi:hypothetical protein